MDDQPPVTPAPPEVPASPSPSSISSTPDKHAHKFIFGYLALIILVAAVGGVYSWQHKKVNSLNTKLLAVNTQVSSLQKQVASLQTAAKKSTTTTSNPYAGWISASLKYEKISYKYPSNWTKKDTSTSMDSTCGNAGDNVILTSPDNNNVVLQTGICVGGSPAKNYGSVPINSLGKSTDLVFQAFSEDLEIPGTPNLPTQVTLGGGFLTSKNIVSYTNNGKTTTTTSDSFIYFPGPITGKAESVSNIKASPDFATAKLIFESMSY